MISNKSNVDILLIKIYLLYAVIGDFPPVKLKEKTKL